MFSLNLNLKHGMFCFGTEKNALNIEWSL